jgi:hypothetical protein
MAAYAPLAGIPQVTQGQEQLNQNALAEYTRAAQEKQQTALLQQQAVAAQQQNQATQAVNQAYQGAFKKDANGNMALDTEGLQQALAANGHGAAVPAVMKGILDYQTAKTAQQEQLQKLQAGGADALGSLGYALQQANYDPQLAHTIIQDHLNDPGLDAQHRQQLIQEQQAIAQNPALIKQMADQWVAQSPAQQAKEIERQKAAADTTKAGASQQEADTKQQEADQKNWEVVAPLGVRVNKVTGEQQPINGAAMSPQMMEGKYVALQQKKAAGQELSPEDAAFVKGYEKFKTLVPAANLTMQAGLLTPEAKQMAAQLYQTTGQLPAGMRSPAMSAGVLNQAAGPAGMPTPNIAANKMAYGTETAEQKAFTSGSQGQQLTAINTARNHMQTFKDTADALDNNNFLKANQIGNYLGMQFGSDKATNFNIAKSAFAGEVGKAFAGANVGVQDRQELMDKISAASSPAQLKGYADTADKLLEGKQKSLKQSYDQAMKGQPNFGGNASETKTYQGHTYAKQSDGSWKLTQ